MSSQDLMRSFNIAFSNNYALVNKWLAYPRQLQQTYGVNPVLAGGCIRDILLGKPVNDLDVFISMSNWRRPDSAADCDSLIHEMAKAENWKLTHESASDFSREVHARIHSVWNFQSEFIQQPYNIIILADDSPAAKVIGDFDVGLNMVGVNTYGALALSQHFVHDVDHQVMTIRNERQRDSLLARYEKLSKKYPWPLVTKEGLEIEKPHAGLILPGA